MDIAVKNKSAKGGNIAATPRGRCGRFFKEEVSAMVMQRGNAIRMWGLSRALHRKLIRAIQLAGFRSLSEWLLRQTLHFISEQEQIHGNLLTALTPIEADVVRAIENGANDPEHIAQETMIAMKRLNRILADLVDRDILEIRRQGGKTDHARGARRPLYFVTEKYQSRSE
jgi:hypothetical protein